MADSPELGYRHPEFAPHIIDRRLFDKSAFLKRVLITRPEPGAAKTAASITALGFEPLIASMLVVTICAARPPTKVAATLLTSGNAVAGCPKSLYVLPVFAVGAATAALAQRVGFRHVFSADGDSTALASLVASKLVPEDGPLFLPTGRGQGVSLAAAMRRLGFRVIRRVAYQAKAVKTLPQQAVTALRTGSVDIAMFYSGETSRQFVRLILAARLENSVRDVEAVSISEQAAMALRPLPWRRIRVAAKPNQDSMLVLLR